MNEKPENSNVSNSRTKVYGSKLKSARVSLQKGIDEIAAELNLHKNIIESIEEMDEANLPSAVFVKGYIRTYAKFVHIDSTDLIKDFSDVDETEMVIEIAKNKNKKDFNFEPNLKLSVAVITLIILLFFFFSFQNTDEMNSDNGEIINAEQSQNNASETEGSVVGDELTETVETEIKTGEPTDNVIENQEVIDEASKVDEVAAEVSETDLENTDENYKNGLLVIANEDSWMEIRNSKNKRVFSNVLLKNGQKYFADDSHYKLIIGRSNAVIIEYLGQVLDFDAYTQPNGISRFDVSKNGLSGFSVPKEPKKVTPVNDSEI